MPGKNKYQRSRKKLSIVFRKRRYIFINKKASITMKVLIASLDNNDLINAKDFGVHGIITNPTLVSAIDKPWKESVKNAAKIIQGPFHLQITEDNKENIIKQAEEFAEVLGDRLVVKICITKESLAAMQVLKKRGFKVNLTCIVSIPQTYFAIQSGADFISIYMGRADDIGIDGVKVISSAINLIDKLNYQTEVIAASMRGVKHYTQAAEAGAHWSACPYFILAKLIKHSVTDKSFEVFRKDWNKIPC